MVETINQSCFFTAIDWILYIYTSILVFYLLFFSIASRKQRKESYLPAITKHRFAVFFPAYKEDAVIEKAVDCFLKQNYPSDLYDIIVISDKMKTETVDRLKEYPIIVIEVNFENSTKAKALQYAINELEKEYDVVIILDADNLVDTDYLSKINDVYASGKKAIQTHRVGKTLKTNMSVLDAVSEEINNTIFRKGHVRVGLSSALIGSGMAFDFKLYKDCITNTDVNHVGEDKQLEIQLFRHHIFVEYMDDIYTYDEKIARANSFFHQRRRWISTQLSNLFIGIKDFPIAFRKGNWDYCDKLFQWTMPSRVVLIGLIFILAIIITSINYTIGIKWILLFFILSFTLLASIPKYLRNRKLCKAVFLVPVLFTLMILNHFRLIGAGKKFIHTSHGE